MKIEEESLILKMVSESPLSVRELAKRMRMRTQSVISLIIGMAASGLLEIRLDRTGMRGRPRHTVFITLIGEDFLSTFNELRIKPLRSSRSDLIRAKGDAEYVNRLLSRGKDPYRAFLELNTIVRDRGDSA